MAVKILNGIDVEGSMNIVASDVPNLDASKITSGTFSTDRIPNLSSVYQPLGDYLTLETAETTFQPLGNYLTSVPAEYLTQTEGDARYLQSLPSHNHDTLYDAIGSADAVNVRIENEVFPAIPTNNNQLTNGAGYITSFDITTQTDSKYLRSNAADTATGEILFDAGFKSDSIMLSGSQNFDNISRSGFYNLYNANTGSTNSPGFPYGTMIVVGNNKQSQGFGFQLAHERLNTAGNFKVRGMNDTASAWSSWATVWTSLDFTNNSSNWNTAYGWGNHASAGYLTSIPSSYATDTEVNSAVSVVNNRIDTEVIPAIGAVTLASLGYTGATNANYITNNNQLTNGAGYATTSYVNTAVANIVDTAPAALNTLNELAAALGDDANFSTTVANNIGAIDSRIDTEVLPAIAAKQNAGNYFTDGDTVLNMANNDGLVYDDSTNRMYVKLDGTNREIYHTGNFTDSSANWNTAYGWGNHGSVGYATQTWVGEQNYASDAAISTAIATVTLASLGYTGATNANYITNNNQLTNGAGYLTTSGKAADSNLLDGLDLHTGRNNQANKVVRTQANGYVEFGWINTTSGNTTSTITDIYVNTNDGYIRKATLAHVKSQLGLGSAAYVATSTFDAAGTGAAAAATVNSRIDAEVLPAIGAVTLASLGYTGATNANYITNNNQLTNGAGYLTSIPSSYATDTEVATAASTAEANAKAYADTRIETEVLPSIPTNNNQLTNGAGYITDGNTNWNNTYGFITSSSSITGTSAGVVRTVSGTSSAELVRGNMGDNDQARILVGASASNAGYLEIATADDGTEPIYVRQYTGTFSTLTRTATILDASGNTSFPGTVSTGSHGNSANWKQAYDNYITGAAFSGTTTKTLTLTQRDGGTLTATFTDLTGTGGDGNDFLISAAWDAGSETITLEVANQAPVSVALPNVLRDTTYTVGDGGLTQKNFTTTLKTKLDGIAASANNYSLPEATATVRGGIELFSDTDQTVAANSISATTGRTYGIQLNSAGQAVVNVPWTDNNTTYTVGDNGLTEKNFTSALKTKLDGIAASANNYVHPTTAGNKHIPAGGAAGQFLKYSADGTAVWAADNNTTYSVGDNGLTEKNFTSTLKTKLDGIAASANNYSLPEATSTVRGGIELFSDTDNPTAANAVSSTAGRTYGIQLNSAGQAVVNVPWVDTNTNTTYSAGTGLTLSGTTFSVTAGTYAAASHTHTPTQAGLGNLSASGNNLAGNFTATGDITAFSDARVKENIETLPNALESVKQMRGVTYNKIGEEKQSIGVIAQELEEVVPQLVHTDEEGMKSVAYGNITALLIEALKEQQEQIEELKAQLDGLTK